MELPNLEKLLKVKIAFNDPVTEALTLPTEAKADTGEQTDEQIRAEAEKQADFKPEPPKEAEPAKEPEPYDFLDGAETAVYILDSVAQFSLPFLYRLKEFTAPERKALKAYARLFALAGLCESRGEELPEEMRGNDILIDLYNRWKDTEALIDEIPLTEKEIGKIQHPLAKVLEKYQKKPGPEFALITACIAVYAPRFTPMAV